MYYVLFDVTLLREWWMPGAVEGGVVHHKLAPMLASALRTDLIVVWHILRLEGYVRSDDGGIIGILNNASELEALRAMIKRLMVNTHADQRCLEIALDDLVFTSPGWHDDQLTVQEFFAWHRQRLSINLDKMVESRGRPRPGTAQADALPADPDGIHGGERPDDAEFDSEDRLPGGDSNASDIDEGHGQVNPDLQYAPRHPLTDEQVFDVVHRFDEAQKQRRNNRAPH